MASVDISYINITSQLGYNSKRIMNFIDDLGLERKFFNIAIERIMHSLLVVLALRNEEIVGITGLEKKWGIIRSYTVVKKEYQGMRIAENLFKERMKLSFGLKCNLIMAVVEKGNIKSINDCISRGYRFGGERWGNLYYFFLVLNFKGYLQYLIIKSFFPLLKLINSFR